MSMYAICRNSLILTLSLLQCYGQENIKDKPIYTADLKWELPISTVFLGTSYFGFRTLEKHASLTVDDVKNLNSANINSFDRPVAFYDPSKFGQSHHTSDMIMNVAVVSPALLLLDRRVRADWKTYTNLLLLTHTINNAVYFATAFSIRRARPLTYNTGLTLEERSGEQKSNSFYSGHVSFSAASTFFMAKTFTDYHHIRGWQRVLIYTGAAIPPAMVGYYRIKAGRHFKTDVITGLVVGAACGIVVPELHRNRNRETRLSVAPLYSSDYSGITLTYHLR